ncbi:hypothetical protein BGZ94_006431 [Podila epigama]|nr:hypothetical protein BGZ94_006431 [Podila epigama]
MPAEGSDGDSTPPSSPSCSSQTLSDGSTESRTLLRCNTERNSEPSSHLFRNVDDSINNNTTVDTSNITATATNNSNNTLGPQLRRQVRFNLAEPPSRPTISAVKTEFTLGFHGNQSNVNVGASTSPNDDLPIELMDVIPLFPEPPLSKLQPPLTEPHTPTDMSALAGSSLTSTKPPRNLFPPEKCAPLISGADAGVGSSRTSTKPPRNLFPPEKCGPLGTSASRMSITPPRHSGPPVPYVPTDTGAGVGSSRANTKPPRNLFPPEKCLIPLGASSSRMSVKSPRNLVPPEKCAPLGLSTTYTSTKPPRNVVPPTPDVPADPDAGVGSGHTGTSSTQPPRNVVVSHVPSDKTHIFATPTLTPALYRTKSVLHQQQQKDRSRVVASTSTFVPTPDPEPSSTPLSASTSSTSSFAARFLQFSGLARTKSNGSDLESSKTSNPFKKGHRRSVGFFPPDREALRSLQDSAPKSNRTSAPILHAPTPPPRVSPRRTRIAVTFPSLPPTHPSPVPVTTASSPAQPPATTESSPPQPPTTTASSPPQSPVTAVSCPPQAPTTTPLSHSHTQSNVAAPISPPSLPPNAENVSSHPSDSTSQDISLQQDTTPTQALDEDQNTTCTRGEVRRRTSAGTLLAQTIDSGLAPSFFGLNKTPSYPEHESSSVHTIRTVPQPSSPTLHTPSTRVRRQRPLSARVYHAPHTFSGTSPGTGFSLTSFSVAMNLCGLVAAPPPLTRSTVPASALTPSAPRASTSASTTAPALQHPTTAVPMTTPVSNRRVASGEEGTTTVVAGPSGPPAPASAPVPIPTPTSSLPPCPLQRRINYGQRIRISPRSAPLSTFSSSPLTNFSSLPRDNQNLAEPQITQQQQQEHAQRAPLQPSRSILDRGRPRSYHPSGNSPPPLPPPIISLPQRASNSRRRSQRERDYDSRSPGYDTEGTTTTTTTTASSVTPQTTHLPSADPLTVSPSSLPTSLPVSSSSPVAFDAYVETAFFAASCPLELLWPSTTETEADNRSNVVETSQTNELSEVTTMEERELSSHQRIDEVQTRPSPSPSPSLSSSSFSSSSQPPPRTLLGVAPIPIPIPRRENTTISMPSSPPPPQPPPSPSPSSLSIVSRCRRALSPKRDDSFERSGDHFSIESNPSTGAKGSIRDSHQRQRQDNVNTIANDALGSSRRPPNAVPSTSSIAHQTMSQPPSNFPSSSFSGPFSSSPSSSVPSSLSSSPAFGRHITKLGQFFFPKTKSKGKERQQQDMVCKTTQTSENNNSNNSNNKNKGKKVMTRDAEVVQERYQERDQEWEEEQRTEADVEMKDMNQGASFQGTRGGPESDHRSSGQMESMPLDHIDTPIARQFM